MDKKVLNMLISKTITPKASLSSLSMCLTHIARTDTESAFTFMDALCNYDISKAALVASRLSDDSDKCYIDYVYDVLQKRCISNDDLLHQDLSAITEFNDHNLFCSVMPKLTEEIVAGVFSNDSCQNVCRLMELVLRYGDQQLIDICRDKFCSFLGRYDSSGDNALKQLLPILIDNNEVDILSKMFKNIGCEQMENLYDGNWTYEISTLTVYESATTELWNAYFSLLFRNQNDFETLLEKGLWHIQLYCSDEIIDEVASEFFLYCAKHLGINHEIFSFMECFEIPKNFSREHTLRYREMLDSLWDKPDELVQFVDMTKLCNPFIEHTTQDVGFTLIHTSQGHQDYNRLASLFENKIDEETILKLFLLTDLKNNLPMEDLLYLCLHYEVTDQMLKVMQNHPFRGKVTKQNGQLIIVAPMDYNVMSLHSLHMPYYALEHIDINAKDMKGNVVKYYISGLYNGQINTTIVTNESNVPADTLVKSQTWEDAVESLTSELRKTKSSNAKVSKNLAVLSFNLDSFIEQNDFDLLTNHIIDNTNKIELYIKAFSAATWNRIFTTQNMNLPAHYYSQFNKYLPCTTQLFKHLFDNGIALETILELYFGSVYKAILPFNQLLEMGDRAELLAMLSTRTIYIRMREGSDILCRPVNMTCAPLCEMTDNSSPQHQSIFPVVITDFEIADDKVTKIKFSNQPDSPSTIKERGSLFGYLALNEPIGVHKSVLISKLPPVDSYDCRELVFNVQRMEQAIILRRANGKQLTELLYAMDDRNPLAFQMYYLADVNYLLNVYSEKRKSSILSSAESMVLNAPDIKALKWIWLNSSIKYYISIPDYYLMIEKRRPELKSQLSELFDKTEFICTADSEGFLWFYSIAQKSIYIGKQYAGMYLKCTISKSDDNICVNVISSQKTPKIIQPVFLCIMQRYNLDETVIPYIYDCLNELNLVTKSQQEIQGVLSSKNEFINLMLECARNNSDATADRTVISSNSHKNITELCRILHSEDFSVKSLEKKVCNFINTHKSYVDTDEMEAVLSVISEEIMLCYPNRIHIISFLQYIFNCYSYHYRDNRPVYIWYEQLKKYFGNDTAEKFRQTIRKSPRYSLNNKFLSIKKGDSSWMNL